MPKKFPPLTPEEVIAILEARGFTHTGTRGSHKQFEDNSAHKVTVDTHPNGSGDATFNPFLIASMISQSGLSRDKFYCSTKATAKKINKRFTKNENG